MKPFVKAVALVALLTIAAAPAARADALDSARAAGQVGERIDGLVGAVGAVSPDVAKTIADINARRMATYRNIAQKTGTSVDAVQAQAGKRLVAATPKGQFVMDGSWHRK